MSPAGTVPAPAGPVVGVGMAAVCVSLLLSLQPLTTDVYLPALPMLRRALSASMNGAQSTISSLILAFGLAQLFWGPVSDRFGRRPVLLAGLGLYTAASIGCALAGTIEALVSWRVLQGAAMAAGIVCARAAVRDLYEPVQGAQVMALALTGLGVVALCGPLLGGVTASIWGWRGPLVVVAVAGATALAFIAWALPETLRLPDARALQWSRLAPTWLSIVRNPVFSAWALLVACTYGGLFTVLASSSFVFMDVFGLSPAAYGASMALGSVSYIVGTVVCRRWIREHGLAGTVARGAWYTLAAGVLAGASLLTNPQSPWFLLLAYCLFAFGHGMHQPCGQAGVVGPFPQAAGSASALAGVVLALVAFGVGRWLGVVLEGGGAGSFAWGLAFWSALTAAVAWTRVRRLPR